MRRRRRWARFVAFSLPTGRRHVMDRNVRPVPVVSAAALVMVLLPACSDDDFQPAFEVVVPR